MEDLDRGDVALPHGDVAEESVGLLVPVLLAVSAAELEERDEPLVGQGALPDEDLGEEQASPLTGGDEGRPTQVLARRRSA
ncbi:hypothetical protein HY251_17000 [bacterium]|nr:hypothetical protein [bacterium]